MIKLAKRKSPSRTNPARNTPRKPPDPLHEAIRLFSYAIPTEPISSSLSPQACLDEALLISLPLQDDAQSTKWRSLIQAYPFPFDEIFKGIQGRWAHEQQAYLQREWRTLQRKQIGTIQTVYQHLQEPDILMGIEITTQTQMWRLLPRVEVRRRERVALGIWHLVDEKDWELATRSWMWRCKDCGKELDGAQAADQHAATGHDIDLIRPHFTASNTASDEIRELFRHLAGPFEWRRSAIADLALTQVNTWELNGYRCVACSEHVNPLNHRCPSCNELEASEPCFRFTLNVPHEKIIVAWRALEILRDRLVHGGQPARCCANTKGRKACRNQLPVDALPTQRFCSPTCERRWRQREYKRRVHQQK